MTKAATTRFLSILLAAVFTLAACSSNSTVTLSDAGVVDESTPTAVPASPAPAGDDPADDADPDDAATDDAPAADDDDMADEPTTAPEPTPTAATTDAFSGAGSGDFCEVARQLNESDPFEDETLGLFTEEFFTVVLDLYGNILAIAPDEIRPDLELTLAAFQQMADLAAQFEYNVFDPAFGEAMEQVDTAALDAAAARIDAYLLEVCGVDTSADIDTDDTILTPDEDLLDDLENLDPTDAAALNELFLSQFNISPELAQCLADELGDIAEAAEDPSILNQPVCGTTLLQVISGLAG